MNVAAFIYVKKQEIILPDPEYIDEDHSMNKENFLKKANYFLRIFFLKCKLCLVRNWFISKSYFNLAKIFVLGLFKISKS